MKTIRVDSIIQVWGGGYPNFGKVGLCVYCGGDPSIARGEAAIGTTGCICNPDRSQLLTTTIGETKERA